eukprot:COSAG06_NODE_4719_length_4010_cov_4.228842_5_plen_209_part_00
MLSYVLVCVIAARQSVASVCKLKLHYHSLITSSIYITTHDISHYDISHYVTLQSRLGEHPRKEVSNRFASFHPHLVSRVANTHGSLKLRDATRVDDCVPQGNCIRLVPAPDARTPKPVNLTFWNFQNALVLTARPWARWVLTISSTTDQYIAYHMWSSRSPCKKKASGRSLPAAPAPCSAVRSLVRTSGSLNRRAAQAMSSSASGGMP